MIDMDFVRAATGSLARFSGMMRQMQRPRVAPTTKRMQVRLRTLAQLHRPRQHVRVHTAKYLDITRVPRRAPRRCNSTKPPAGPNPNPNPTPELGSPEASLSLSQRLRKLSREYGYTALGVYMGLLVLDFPFCFLAVQYLGADRIGRYEHVVVENLKNIVRIPFPGVLETKDTQEATATAEEVKEQDAQVQKGEATIWTQLALAFVIHKSFIFARVPLTAALTPKVVKTLRGWGWDIGKRRPKSK